MRARISLFGRQRELGLSGRAASKEELSFRRLIKVEPWPGKKVDEERGSKARLWDGEVVSRRRWKVPLAKRAATPNEFMEESVLMRISRLTLTLVLLFPIGASAQSLECRYVQTSAARLACYDKAMPPSAPPQERVVKPGPNRYIEEQENEDARMRRALRPICKNC